MASYVVMEPPAATAAEAADRAVVIRDGFSFLAFLLPPLWLLWHRLWLEALLAIAASVALTALGDTAGLGSLGGALSLLVSLFVGLEGQAMRIAALRRRGWQDWGVVEASRQDEADLRYALDVSQEAIGATPPVKIVPEANLVPRTTHAEATLGLVPFSRRS